MMEVFIGRVEAECPFCRTISSVDVHPTKSTMLFFSGVLTAQRAFPYLSATNREILISGICADCQEKIFD